MDRPTQDFVNSLGDHPMRSRLEPYHELIRALRRKRFPYRKIASILQERYQLETSKSAIHDFLRVRRNHSQADPEAVAPPPPPQTARGPSDAAEGATIGSVHSPQPGSQTDVYARMEELKQRKRVPRPPPPKPRFHYEEGEPLRLIDPNPKKD